MTRTHIERLAEAIKDVAADEFELTVDKSGKVQVGAVERVERVRPLRLTPRWTQKPKVTA